MNKNIKFLINIIDKCLMKLDPDFIGTWQERAERLLELIEKEDSYTVAIIAIVFIASLFFITGFLIG